MGKKFYEKFAATTRAPKRYFLVGGQPAASNRNNIIIYYHHQAFIANADKIISLVTYLIINEHVSTRTHDK